jgi:hypothetical protein
MVLHCCLPDEGGEALYEFLRCLVELCHVLIRNLIGHDGLAQLLQDGQEHAAIQRQDQVGLDTELGSGTEHQMSLFYAYRTGGLCTSNSSGDFLCLLSIRLQCTQRKMSPHLLYTATQPLSISPFRCKLAAAHCSTLTQLHTHPNISSFQHKLTEHIAPS